VADLIHAEQGCELYAVHSDGDLIVIVERWSSQDDLDAHSRGQALTTLTELNDGLLSGPADVFVLENVPMGEPHLGTIQ
jgi:quinol monooxygenase YgiN